MRWNSCRQRSWRSDTSCPPPISTAFSRSAARPPTPSSPTRPTGAWCRTTPSWVWGTASALDAEIGFLQDDRLASPRAHQGGHPGPRSLQGRDRRARAGRRLDRTEGIGPVRAARPDLFSAVHGPGSAHCRVVRRNHRGAPGLRGLPHAHGALGPDRFLRRFQELDTVRDVPAAGAPRAHARPGDAPAGGIDAPTSCVTRGGPVRVVRDQAGECQRSECGDPKADQHPGRLRGHRAPPLRPGGASVHPPAARFR